MRVIIGGAGRVGSELARAMRAEMMDVVLIDHDSRAVKNAQSLDALVIHGDITSRRSLKKRVLAMHRSSLQSRIRMIEISLLVL